MKVTFCKKDSDLLGDEQTSNLKGRRGYMTTMSQFCTQGIQKVRQPPPSF